MGNLPEDSYCYGTPPWETPEESECPLCNSGVTLDINGIPTCDNKECNYREEVDLNEKK